MQEEGDWQVHGSTLLSHRQPAAMLKRSWQTAASLPTPMELKSWMSRTQTWTGVPPLLPSPATQWTVRLCSHGLQSLSGYLMSTSGFLGIGDGSME